MTAAASFDWTHILYRFFNERGRLLYVGITNSIPGRFTAHRNTKGWWSEVDNCKIEFWPSRPDLEEAERAAIAAEDPRYNIAGSLRALRLVPHSQETPMSDLQGAPETAKDLEVHPDGLNIDGTKLSGLKLSDISIRLVPHNGAVHALLEAHLVVLAGSVKLDPTYLDIAHREAQLAAEAGKPTTTTNTDSAAVDF